MIIDFCRGSLGSSGAVNLLDISVIVLGSVTGWGGSGAAAAVGGAATTSGGTG